MGKMGFKLSSEDAKGFKLLFGLAFVFALISALVYYVVQLKFIVPLGIDAPFDRFSEGRALQHLRVLAQEIDGRQVSQTLLWLPLLK